MDHYVMINFWEFSTQDIDDIIMSTSCNLMFAWPTINNIDVCLAVVVVVGCRRRR